MAIKIEELSDLLIQAGVEEKIRSLVLKEAKELEATKKEDRENDASPKAKSEFVIVVRGNEELAATLQQGWILSVPTGDDPTTLDGRFKAAMRTQMDAAKRKKPSFSSWFDFFRGVKRAFSKEQNFQPKTKEPVRVLVLTKDNPL